MSKAIFMLAFSVLILVMGCASTPKTAKKWSDLSYGADRKGQNVTVAGTTAMTPAEISACDVEASGNGAAANWNAVSQPNSPTEEIYQRLITSNGNGAAAASDARKLVNTALKIHEHSGISVVGVDTCDVLKGESLTTLTREVEKSAQSLSETGEFCATSFAGIAINDQIETLGRTPEGALMSVEKYEACGIGPPGIAQAATTLEGTVEGLRDSGRTELNPSEFRCSR